MRNKSAFMTIANKYDSDLAKEGDRYIYTTGDAVAAKKIRDELVAQSKKLGLKALKRYSENGEYVVSVQLANAK